MTIEKIISISKNKDLLKLLFNEHLTEVKGQYKNSNSLSIQVIEEALNGKAKLSKENIDIIEEMNNQEEYFEVYLALLVCEKKDGLLETSKLIAFSLLNYLERLAKDVQTQSEPYNIGYFRLAETARIIGKEVSAYFGRRKDLKHELITLCHKSVITNKIFCDYPELVGPDMIAVGEKFEEFGNPVEACKAYNAVYLDFLPFLEECDETELDKADFIIFTALKKAIEGLARLEKKDSSKILDKIEMIFNKSSH